MKNGFAFLMLLCLCACAGNPPQWWNPSGAYGAETAQQNSSSAPARPSLSAPVTTEQEEPYPIEQTIEPAVESYEELNLSPLGVEQEAGEIVPPAPAAAPQSDTEQALPVEERAADADTVPVQPEENLPPDGSLPPPSVLQ